MKLHLRIPPLLSSWMTWWLSFGNENCLVLSCVWLGSAWTYWHIFARLWGISPKSWNHLVAISCTVLYSRTSIMNNQWLIGNATMLTWARHLSSDGSMIGSQWRHASAEMLPLPAFQRSCLLRAAWTEWLSLSLPQWKLTVVVHSLQYERFLYVQVFRCSRHMHSFFIYRKGREERGGGWHAQWDQKVCRTAGGMHNPFWLQRSSGLC